ncbi:MAG TPA: plastocyanin/azurin family copper-binding protein [Solirubrobacterales bacterium]|jgi:plastocyanin
MDYSTVFYILGSVLAVSAVVTSFIGLRLKAFPGRAAPLVFLCFAVLVGGATTFAVLNGQDEQEARATELETADVEAEEEEKEAAPQEVGAPAGGAQQAPAERKEKGGGGTPQKGASEPGGTLQLAADPSAIAFDTTSLTSKPGKVTIDFDNPSPLEHNVAIEKDGKLLAESETIASGKTSVSVDLEPGTYTFLCTIPGHAEAGMEGTLTVK